MKVLILGGHGYLGPHVEKALEPYYQLRITDIKPIDTKHESMQVDVSSLDEVMRAAEGMDAIINCSVLRHDRQIGRLPIYAQLCCWLYLPQCLISQRYLSEQG